MSRKTPMYLACFMAMGLVVMTGCLEDQCDRTQTFIQYEPVYKPIEELRTDIEVTEPRELCDPGNLYYYNGYLLVNERREGVHVIDNSNPFNPVPVAFIEIPGNLDMAVRNNVLYADMYLDLVAIDISNPEQATLVNRNEDVFSSFYPFVGSQGFIVDYIPTEQTIEVDCGDNRFGMPWFWTGGVFFASIEVDFANQSSGSASSTGIGGSMARFTIAKDHLYTLDDWRMQVFDVQDPAAEHVNTVEVSWGIETLFPYGEYLFIGANEGMFIFDNSDPVNPTYLSQFTHARACDPVFVSEDIAYVTLRDGNECNTFINQLDVIDVSNIVQPELLYSYPMENPHGLSVTGETLYLCEGAFGFKVFDAEQLDAIDQNLLDKVDVQSFDVIVLPPGDLVMLIGRDGLYQYDASSRDDLVEISRIPVNRK